MSLVLFPRHPLHMWKYHVTLYHFPSRVPLTRASDSHLQLRKQPSLAWSAAHPATTGWLLLEAELSVCFHCIVGNERWGVPWSTFEWGLWGACGGKIALCTQ